MSTKWFTSGGSRPYGGMISRFRNLPSTEPAVRSEVSLPADSPPMLENRTMFPARLMRSTGTDRPLIDSYNNGKIGKTVTVGPWRGFQQYHLSLEERATCPASCHLLAECFGNGIPNAKRWVVDAALYRALETQVYRLWDIHQTGFSVRLHLLGDFQSLIYLAFWADLLRNVDALHVWGYTAHPLQSEIGAAIEKMNRDQGNRWRVRFSTPEHVATAFRQVSTAWVKPERFEYDAETSSVVCPQEVGKVTHCGACGICWNPKLDHVRVIFLGHGNPMMGRPVQKAGPPKRRATPEAARVIVPSVSDDPVAQFLATRGATILPAGRAKGVRRHA